MPEKYRQCSLIANNAYRACWLPSAGLKKGMRIALKEETDGVIWTVAGISSIELDRDQLHTDWKCGENGEIAKAPKSNFRQENKKA